MLDRQTITVRCEPDADGWRCAVAIGSDSEVTQHDVTVNGDYLRLIAQEGSSVGSVVEASFRFLLEREQRESILRRFDLPAIGHFFPQYEEVIRARLGGV